MTTQWQYYSKLKSTLTSKAEYGLIAQNIIAFFVHKIQTRATACWRHGWAGHKKPDKVSVRPAKTQISLGIRPVCWSESWLSVWRNLRALAIHWSHSEDSDQTERFDSSLGAHSFYWFCHVVAHVCNKRTQVYVRLIEVLATTRTKNIFCMTAWNLGSGSYSADDQS